METSSSVVSPSSEKPFCNRTDAVLDNHDNSSNQSLPIQMSGGRSDRTNQLKVDAMLLLRGFDSVSSSLSQLSANIELALQGARDLARPPTLSEIVHSALENTKTKDEHSKDRQGEKEEEESKDGSRGLKRKKDSQEFAENEGDDDDAVLGEGQSPKELGKLKKCKHIALSMANKAASIARELRSVKSDLVLMQQQCAFLEEENVKLRNGFAEGSRPEEDDLMRLQMEALLAEKSKLATENANLSRENECLSHLVQYHQLASHSQDLSESYEHDKLRGMRLDFSSPEDTQDTRLSSSRR